MRPSTARPPSPLRAPVRDRWGFAHSGDDPDAIAAFEAAVAAIAAHRPGAAPALEQALAADPGLVAARALGGFACLIMGRAELCAPARLALAEAEAALAARGGGTADERALVAALARACAGGFLPAAAILEEACLGAPRALLAIKLAQSLRFMAGDLPGMLRGTRAALPRLDAQAPGYGFVVGCHAFALEEAGLLDEAEVAGRRAAALEPADAWGRHAVAHVMETSGRTGEGIAWLEETRSAWGACNNFAYHMAWHLALFHLERREPERVLALYDAEIRPDGSADFRDVANAVSLLCRLAQDGIDVADRVEALRDVARVRARDTTLVFATLHGLLACIAADDRAGVAACLAGLAAKAGEADEQARVVRRVGLDLARVLADEEARLTPARLADLVACLPEIGGSHAQRDVFVRLLAARAAEAGDRAGLGVVLGARRAVKRDDRFARRLLAEIGPERPRATGTLFAVL